MAFYVSSTMPRATATAMDNVKSIELYISAHFKKNVYFSISRPNLIHITSRGISISSGSFVPSIPKVLFDWKSLQSPVVGSNVRFPTVPATQQNVHVFRWGAPELWEQHWQLAPRSAPARAGDRRALLLLASWHHCCLWGRCGSLLSALLTTRVW